MPYLHEEELNAFRDELRKEAAPNLKALLGRVAGAGGGIGAGALAGGLGGTTLGAIRGAHKAKEEGGSALSGALGGASKGLVQGAALGGLVGGVGGALNPKAVEELAKKEHIWGSGARFGQRQVHGFTGWKPEGGLSAMGAGANNPPGMELSSLPGYVKAIKEHGAKAIKADVANQWHSGGIASKALGVGLPATMLAAEVAKKENPTGPGKGESVGRGIGGTVGGFLGSSLPITGQMALGGAMGAAGGLAGRAVDRLRGRRSTPNQTTPPEHSQGQHVPTERISSPAAMGQVPEGMPA